MTDAIQPNSCIALTVPKFTAAQIEKDCPARLQEIGRKITERFEEAREQTKRLDDHVIAINKLIAEAQELCDVGGYDKFRELFCPQLGKSQAYVRLAIAAGKTTLVEHRTRERDRKRKTRADQKAAAANSGTVPEKSEPETLGAPTETGTVETTSIAPEQMPEPAKSWRAVSRGDGALTDFSLRVMDLVRITRNKGIERFAKTSVTADDLAWLGKRLSDIANRKTSEAVKPAPIMALPDNGTVSIGQSAADVRENALSKQASIR